MRASKERETEILELINKGLKNYDIHKATGASHKLIDRIRAENQMERTKGERDPSDANFTYKQIAQWNYIHARYGKKGV